MCMSCVRTGAEGGLQVLSNIRPIIISLPLPCAAPSLNVSVLFLFSLSTAQHHNFIKVTQDTRLALPLQLPLPHPSQLRIPSNNKR